MESLELVLLLSELEVSLLCALESDLWFFCLLWFLLVLALMACVACQYGVPWWISDDGRLCGRRWGLLILRDQDHTLCALHA